MINSELLQLLEKKNELEMKANILRECGAIVSVDVYVNTSDISNTIRITLNDGHDDQRVWVAKQLLYGKDQSLYSNEPQMLEMQKYLDDRCESLRLELDNVKGLLNNYNR